MITCPNCQHDNPEGAAQCEACYTPLPQQANCRNCGATLLSNATFCGECGIQFPFDTVSAEESPLPPPPPEISEMPPPPPSVSREPEFSQPPDISTLPPPPPSFPNQNKATQLQGQTPSLFHVQTQTELELPQGFDILHIGKPNEKIPPEIDVSGFPNSDIVSRIHAAIRVEGNIFYIEDVGSSNGTYINHTVLSPGDRHCLENGDRLSLGKGDLVTFIFRLS